MTDSLEEVQEQIKIMKEKEENRKEKLKIAQKKYAMSDKGKAARSRSYKKNYKPTGNSRGRPRKDSEENIDNN